MKWLRNGTEVKTQRFCSTFVHHLQNVDYEDQAEYACQVELENGTVIGPIIAGGMPLNVVGKCSVVWCVCLWCVCACVLKHACVWCVCLWHVGGAASGERHD